MADTRLTSIAAREYLGRYPDKPTMTIAKIMKTERPKLFPTIEHARDVLRYHRGRRGDKARIKLNDKRFMLPKPTKDNPLSLPEAIKDDFAPIVLPDRLKRIGIISDVHVPYHDERALTAALTYLHERQIDMLIINGDFADCYALSRFDKDPERRDFAKERESVVHALMAIRKTFPEVPIIYKEGNHEARWKTILATRAPELIGLTEFRLEVIFDLFNLGIQWVDGKRPINYRELSILHGHELPAKSGGVNPARTTLLKTRENTIVGHYHRKTNDCQTRMKGEMLQAWSTGCLCGLNPDYMPINDWQHGFAVVNGGADWSIDNKLIIKGSVV
jgi:predicted phosphodiesterase